MAQYEGSIKSAVLYPQNSGVPGDRAIRAYVTIRILNEEAWGKGGLPKLDVTSEITGLSEI